MDRAWVINSLPFITGTFVPAIFCAIKASLAALSTLLLPFTQVIPKTILSNFSANFRVVAMPMISSSPPWVSIIIYLSSSLTKIYLIYLTCIFQRLNRYDLIINIIWNCSWIYGLDSKTIDDLHNIKREIHGFGPL